MARSSPDISEMAREALAFDKYQPFPSRTKGRNINEDTSVKEMQKQNEIQEDDHNTDDGSTAFLEQLAMSRDIRQSIHHVRDKAQVTQDHSMVMLERVQQLRERKRLLFEQARVLQEKNKHYRTPSSRQRRNLVIPQEHPSPGLMNKAKHSSNERNQQREIDSPVATQASSTSCPPTPKDKVVWDSTSIASPDEDAMSSNGTKTPTSYAIFPRSKPSTLSTEGNDLTIPILSHSPDSAYTEAKSDENPQPQNSKKKLPPLKIDLPPLIITTKNKKKKSAQVVPTADASSTQSSPTRDKYTHSPKKPVSSSSDETTATCSATKSATSLLDQTKNEQYYPISMPSPIHVTIPPLNINTQQVSPLPDHFHSSDLSSTSQQSPEARQERREQNIHRRPLGPQHEKDTLQKKAAKQPKDQDFVSLVDQKIALADELADMREELASKKFELEHLTRQCHRMQQEKKQLEEMMTKQQVKQRSGNDSTVDATQCSPERLLRRINGNPPEQGFSMLSLLNKYRSEKVI